MWKWRNDLVIALRHKCLFIHVPKTGGVSVRHWLSEATNDETVLWWNHTPAWWWWHALNEPKTFFKFAFVRNPWDRVVSQYFWGLANNLSVVVPHKTFEDYVHNGLSQFLDQSNWLVDKKGKLLVDFVGRYEQLDDDFRYVAKQIGVEHRKPLARLNGSDHKPYASYYNAETVEIVRRTYAEDVERFQYPVLKV